MIRLLAHSTEEFSLFALTEHGNLKELCAVPKPKEAPEGSIFIGRVTEALRGMDAVFADTGEENAGFLRIKGELPKPGTLLAIRKIKMRRGQKGAVFSRELSIAGRFCVVVLDSKSIGISKKITDKALREKLTEAVKEALPEGMGAIIRTEAAACSYSELLSELSLLIDAAKDIPEAIKNASRPSLIYSPDPDTDAARGLFTKNVDEFITDDEAFFQKAKKAFGGDLRIRLYEEQYPVFDEYFVTSKIKEALSRKVWLKSGGFLIFDETEALHAIDVNSGKFSGLGTNIKAMSLKVNLEAVKEAARQIRLRNLCGTIIVDLIGVPNKEASRAIIAKAKEAMAEDKREHKVWSITELGLLQISRTVEGAPLKIIQKSQNFREN